MLSLLLCTFSKAYHTIITCIHSDPKWLCSLNCVTKYWQDLNLGHLPLYQTLHKSRLYCAFRKIHHTTAMQLYFGAWSCAWYSSQNIDLIILQAHIANRNPIENYGMQLHVLTVSPQVKFLYNHIMSLIGNTCSQSRLLSLFPIIIWQHLSSQENK